MAETPSKSCNPNSRKSPTAVRHVTSTVSIRSAIAHIDFAPTCKTYIEVYVKRTQNIEIMKKTQPNQRATQKPIALLRINMKSPAHKENNGVSNINGESLTKSIVRETSLYGNGVSQEDEK
jgi:hypothetical protein